MTAHLIAQTDPQLEAALKRLDLLVDRAPHLAELASFYRSLLPVMREAQENIAPFTLEPATAQRKLTAGVPLLVDEDLPLDSDAIRSLLLKLCRIIQEDGLLAASTPASVSSVQTPIDQAGYGSRRVSHAAAAAQIQQAIEHNTLDTLTVVSALASGEWHSIELAAAALDADLLRMLAENTLKPWLRVWMQGLKDDVSLATWQRGQCPFCGSEPALAEIQGKEGACFLRCGMCGAGWPYPRLQCAFCGNNDHRSLNLLHVEGEQVKYRVQVCDRCHGYLKTVVTFAPTPVDQLVVEDLATLHLDRIAAERNFTRVLVH